MEIVGLIVSLNREERGLHSDRSALDEIRETWGFPAHAIVTMHDVVEALYNRETGGRVVIDDAIRSSIDAYYAEYGIRS